MTAVDVPPPPLDATLPVGVGQVLVGKYRLERILGAGGMGFVVLATHLELEQLVAIKMMRAEGLRSPDARARFAREAKAAVRLKSQHVARVSDVGTDENGAPFLVMEYLDGQDLATVLEEGGGQGLPVEVAIAYVLQVCEAVAEAHALGIVHRDLKPRNIFVTTGVDGNPLLKVLDFGISKLLTSPGATADVALTRTTDVMGSPSYMAPEQLRAARDVDERSDIWSLGVMLYEVITGRLPWEADSVSELSAMVLRDDPRPMRTLREGVSPELEAIVAQCLAKERTKRFTSVVELARALEPHAMGLAAGSAERITSVARTSRMPARMQIVRDLPSSGSRVAVSGGTSVSWGETELDRPKLSVPPPATSAPSRSRTGVVVIAGVLAVVALAAGGFALSKRGSTSTATGPVLPEDRGAIRPPPSPPAPSPSAAPAAVESARAAEPAPIVTATSLAAVPRRANPAASPRTTSSVAPDKTSTAATPSPAPAAPNAHDLAPIPRK